MWQRHAARSVLVPLTLILAAGAGGAEPLNSPLDPAQETALRELAELRWPFAAEALLPDADALAKATLPANRVPPAVRRQALAWIRKAVAPGLLPEKLDDLLVPLAGLTKHEWAIDGERRVPWRGDYFACRYARAGVAMLLQENGQTVTLVVVEPAGAVPNPDAAIRRCIERAINAPEGKTGGYTLHVSTHGGLAYGTATCDWDDTRPPKRGALPLFWQRLSVCSDGRFVLLSIPETEGETDGRPMNPFDNPPRF